MLAINDLTYYVGGDRIIYESASLHIKPNDKIGLIGLNGKGKSTLLRLIHGDISPDKGEITKAKDCTIGFLNQDLLSVTSEKSILHVCMEAFGNLIEIQDRIDDIILKLETSYTDELVTKLTTLQEQFEQMEGYSAQAKAEEILEGIGFKTSDLERPLNEFSGGWRMRVMLARLLLEKPSLLLLDEPTNHLDLPSIEWVENYLKSYSGAYIVVSHDRRFLDEVSEITVEVDQFQLNVYAGNYSFYLRERELRREIQQNAYENQQQKIKQTEKFIERFRAKSTKARQVQSRIKALEKMDMVSEVSNEDATISFHFPVQQHSGKKVIELKDFSKNYGDLEIFRHASAEIMRGDKIALIGANGKGKSTLLRIISGMETFDGYRSEGHNVQQAFYAQHQLESLGINHEILEELKLAGTGRSEQELRTVLGGFLFEGDDVYKKIKVLSGGEKSRVALARTLLGNANFLMLDEPTNHLDIQSENILIQALQKYEGTFIVVSHNRHFINEVANKIWYIEDKQLKVYPGTYKEYVWWMENREQREADQPAKASKTTDKSTGKKPKTEKTGDNTKEIERLEEEILSLEQVKADIESQLADPEVFENPEKSTLVNQRYTQVSNKLNELTSQWEELIG